MNRTPNYVLTRDFMVAQNGRDYKKLPCGSFVRPIELRYVPQHVIDDPLNTFFDVKLEVYCYTRYGLISIPKKDIRET